jgi:hypothetical protein
MPPVADTLAMLDGVSPERIDPTTLFRIGSITYDREENGYNLEWESRADFNEWLTHKQMATGIEIQISKTQKSKLHDLYSTCETLHYAHNTTGGKSHYVKKMMCERKINSKQIEGGCPCFVQIKTYPHTNTVLGKYYHNHSHPTGKDNLKYIWIQVCTHELIEAWVYYGVTDQEIVSDPPFYHDQSN